MTVMVGKPVRTRNPCVLIVDDEAHARNDVRRALGSNCLRFQRCRSLAEFRSRLDSGEEVGAVILDLTLRDGTVEVPWAVETIKAHWENAVVIVLSNAAVPRVDRKGTDQCITKEEFYADRMVLSTALIEAMERRVREGTLDANVVDRIRQDLPEKIATLKGYVHQVCGDSVEVIVDEMGPDGRRHPKRLLMDADTFERQGLLLEDMPFVYRLYWQGGKMISEVVPDAGGSAEPALDIDCKLKKVKEIRRTEAGRNRDGGQGA